MLTFQDIIAQLNAFWEKQGCILHVGYDLEVGAGTFNPVTFLRCLGPEPYKTAYVEPSRRPKDARYGENPNRVQLFHQYQVIIKPSPENIQQLYLDSLEALGFDLKKHDIRFVHDDWESPTLGAWGLGWEVWCDGMEVTQFTYFQALGSLPLKPVAVEITYGLERLAMYIQNKSSLFDVLWNHEMTFRDIAHQNEVEWSAYNFEKASSAMWFHHFQDYEQEAKAALAQNLPIPAYDFVIKASHAFNMLEARGAFSVTERTGYIARIRDLARAVASEYIRARERLHFPLLGKQREKPIKPAPLLKKNPTFSPQKKRTFLLEIGSEPLPATFIPIGCQQLEKSFRTLLTEHGIAFEGLKTFGTPQRLAIEVAGLAEGTPSKKEIKRGPSLTSAFTGKGDLTAQGVGFFKSLGHPHMSLEDIRKGKSKQLFIDTVKTEEYLFAHITQEGVSTFALLHQKLAGLIGSLEFPKKMRWGNLDIGYARPIHWLLALFGETVIPFQYANVRSDRFSFGHAQLSPKKVRLKRAENYLSSLKKQYVLADIEERKAEILQQLQAIEKKTKARVVEQNKVLSQVLYLTEWPLLTHARFDPHYLRAPKEVLISEMVEHQKYFPLIDARGHLKNIFIITADNKPNEMIRRGNQKVLSARLADGIFLYTQDLKAPLETLNEKLKSMTYQKELGSMFDKVMRLTAIAQVLNRHLALADQNKVQRAALLSKADLASLLVAEFPELQGTIGKHYALAQKEDTEVAQALEEQWMPRFEKAPLPQSATGLILSLSDKIDNLLSCYSVGLKPSSSSDPYALRRQAIGLLRILIQTKESIDLKELLEEVCAFFPHITNAEPLVQEILTFITARAKNLFFEEYGFQKDESDAVLQGTCIDPFDQFCKTQALHAFRKTPQFAKLWEVYKRSKGQLDKPTSTPFKESLLKEPAEHQLLSALDSIHKHWQDLLREKNYKQAFVQIATLQKPLAKLFDTVQILVDDPALRANRIALLQKVFTYFYSLLDFSKIKAADVSHRRSP